MIRPRTVWPGPNRRSPDRNDGIRLRRLDEIPLWSIILAIVMAAWMLTGISAKLWPAIDNNPNNRINSAFFA